MLFGFVQFYSSTTKKKIYFSPLFTVYCHTIRLIAINRQFYVIYFPRFKFCAHSKCSVHFVAGVLVVLQTVLLIYIYIFVFSNSWKNNNFKCKSIVIFHKISLELKFMNSLPSSHPSTHVYSI